MEYKFLRIHFDILRMLSLTLSLNWKKSHFGVKSFIVHLYTLEVLYPESSPRKVHSCARSAGHNFVNSFKYILVDSRIHFEGKHNKRLK